MTRAKNHRVPGTTLLKIARLLLSERLVSAVVQPTICDLQREVTGAGPGRIGRLRAQGRGYCAFWKVVLIAPFASGLSRDGDGGVFAFPDSVARLSVGSIVLALLALAGPHVGASVSILCAGAALFAIVIHRWYQRHPSELPAPPASEQKGSPRINFSSTQVAGNVGGLIFAVGSVFIVAVGVPSVIWFLFTAIAAGCVVAWALARWRTSHPHGGLPDKGIVLR
jgi:hypothetical protein